MTEKQPVSFSKALDAMKAGQTCSRVGWNNTDIKVRAQFPTKDSMNTEPYIVMEKNGKCFPLDISCESLFANDWIIHLGLKS